MKNFKDFFDFFRVFIGESLNNNVQLFFFFVQVLFSFFGNNFNILRIFAWIKHLLHHAGHGLLKTLETGISVDVEKIIKLLLNVWS